MSDASDLAFRADAVVPTLLIDVERSLPTGIDDVLAAEELELVVLLRIGVDRPDATPEGIAEAPLGNEGGGIVDEGGRDDGLRFGKEDPAVVAATVEEEDWVLRTSGREAATRSIPPDWALGLCDATEGKTATPGDRVAGLRGETGEDEADREF